MKVITAIAAATLFLGVTAASAQTPSSSASKPGATVDTNKDVSAAGTNKAKHAKSTSKSSKSMTRRSTTGSGSSTTGSGSSTTRLRQFRAVGCDAWIESEFVLEQESGSGSAGQHHGITVPTARRLIKGGISIPPFSVQARTEPLSLLNIEEPTFPRRSKSAASAINACIQRSGDFVRSEFREGRGESRRATSRDPAQDRCGGEKRATARANRKSRRRPARATIPRRRFPNSI